MSRRCVFSNGVAELGATPDYLSRQLAAYLANGPAARLASKCAGPCSAWSLLEGLLLLLPVSWGAARILYSSQSSCRVQARGGIR